MVPPARSDRTEQARQLKQLARAVETAFEDRDFPEIDLDAELGGPLEVGREFPIPESRLLPLTKDTTHSYWTWTLRRPREHRRWLEYMVETRNREALARMLDRLDRVEPQARDAVTARTRTKRRTRPPDIENENHRTVYAWMAEHADTHDEKTRSEVVAAAKQRFENDKELAPFVPANERQYSYHMDNYKRWLESQVSQVSQVSHRGFSE